MIGYYVHHQGAGHLNRARTVAALWGEDITGLSTLARPAAWPGRWIRLEDDAPTGDAQVDVTAGGYLHWVPVGHTGLRQRMGTLASWLAEAGPSLLVSDHSVEVTLLARLHGVPVVSVVLPGSRSDPGHLLGYGVSEALVAMWPPEARVRTDLPIALRSRIRCLGGMSRFPPVTSTSPARQATARQKVVVLWGSGGAGPPMEDLRTARDHSPGWDWTILGGESWDPNPFSALCSADVVLTHGGQNAVAETAAARRPAIIIPQDRPFHEQRILARTLRHPRWPAVVCDEPPFPARWSQALERAAHLDGQEWTAWCDGHANERFCQVLHEVSGA